jgi:hypothetical protein
VEGEGELEVGDEPDRWAPPVGEREREERRRGTGGPLWAESGAGRGGDGGLGSRGRLDRFSFFPFLFQIHFKPIFPTIFKSNLLHLFKFKF